MRGFKQIFGVVHKWPVLLLYCAQRTHRVALGTSRIRPMGIRSPQAWHSPNLSSFNRSIARTKSAFCCSAVRRAASLTLRLLMASIRLTRPIAFSGGMGLVSSRYSAIRSSNKANLDATRDRNVANSSSVQFAISLFFIKIQPPKWPSKPQGCATFAP